LIRPAILYRHHFCIDIYAGCLFEGVAPLPAFSLVADKFKDHPADLGTEGICNPVKTESRPDTATLFRERSLSLDGRCHSLADQ
jgi:hypothetical protein